VGRIKVLNVDGSGARFPTQIEGRGPVWSPDGRKIAFTDIGGSIHIVNIDGTGHTQLPLESAEVGISWSPDGRMLAFSKATPVICGDADEVKLIYVVPVAGGRPRSVTKGTCSDGDYSPDWHR
jgi:Tol biopolymer transport system component